MNRTNFTNRGVHGDDTPMDEGVALLSVEEGFAANAEGRNLRIQAGFAGCEGVIRPVIRQFGNGRIIEHARRRLDVECTKPEGKRKLRLEGTW